MIKNIINKKKILFISNKINKDQIGGRKNLTNLNEKVLKSIFRENFFTFKLEKKKNYFNKKNYICTYWKYRWSK